MLYAIKELILSTSNTNQKIFKFNIRKWLRLQQTCPLQNSFIIPQDSGTWSIKNHVFVFVFDVKTTFQNFLFVLFNHDLITF